MDIPQFHRGLIIVEPYGTYIRKRTKSMIVKSKKIASIIDQDLLLIQNKKGLGMIRLDFPTRISIGQFQKLYKYHQISEDDRRKWWPKYRYLYAYPIIEAKFFQKPLLVDYSTGPQVTIMPSRLIYKRVFVGMSGYYYRYMYPKRVKDLLDYYSREFNSVEINTTFYRFPLKSTINNLAKYDLIYSIKVNQYITHSKKLKGIKQYWQKFYDAFRPIYGKIKCFLFQFSSKFYFTDENYSRLAKLSPILNKKHRYVFEFRDNSWFQNIKITKLFSKNNWTMVISHVVNGFNPPLRKYQNTSDIVYFRLHGTTGQYQGEYSDGQLKQIMDFVAEKPIKYAFVYFNNTDGRGSAFRDAQRLIKKVSAVNQ